jgi:hypothetical protein
MGEGNLLAAARALTALLLGLAAGAQSIVYRERWNHLHLEARRAEVWAALAGVDRAAHDRIADRVASLFAEHDAGMPFAPVALALAELRGVAADDDFVLRAAIGAIVLPEVIDPDAGNEACRAANVTVELSFAVAWPPPAPAVPAGPGEVAVETFAVTFDVAVENAAHEIVWTGGIERASERDVRMAQAGVQVPCANLPDGAYRARVRTRIRGAAPRAHDPDVAWTFHVLRGYQKRAETAMGQAARLDAATAAADRAIVLGACAEVHRAYTGESFAVASDGVRDLERLERALANVAEKRAADDGLAGDACLALPVTGEPPLRCVLRRAGEGRHPLVVFAGGSPAYDAFGDRPAAPATRDPRWLAHELAGFGSEAHWHVAFLESPGVGRDYARDLREVLPQLAQLAGSDGLPLLVCEREAASIVGLGIGSLRALVRGVVCVGGGAMAPAALQANGPLPVRFAAPRGGAEDGLARVLDYVEARKKAGDWHGDVAWLSPARPAWPFALAAFAPDIAAFAQTVFLR